MATSGVYDLTVTRNEIIRQAAQMLGALGAGIAMNATMQNDFAHALNAMVKRWECKPNGPRLWSISEATLFPVPGQIKYTMGTGATDHVAETYYTTTLDGAEAGGQTILSVASTANMANGDQIGIMLDSGVLHWSTVSSFVTNDTVTVANALPSAAASGNKVFYYTDNIPRPLKIVDYRRFDLATSYDTPVLITSRFDYNTKTDKAVAGQMLEAFYETRVSLGNLYLYKVPATVTHLLNFTYYKPLEIFSASSDNPSFPAEWVQALEFNLALIMSPQYPAKAPKDLTNIAAQAKMYLDELEGWDREIESIDMAPENDPTRR